MSLFNRACAFPGCPKPADRTRCQDCGRPFCLEHVAAREFFGYLDGSGDTVSRTRYVCAACAARSTHRSSSPDDPAFHSNALQPDRAGAAGPVAR